MSLRSLNCSLFPPLMVRLMVATVALASLPICASAQEWGAKMLSNTEVKFGTVARLADTTYKIKVKNLYVDPVSIDALSVSCGCISWVDHAPIVLASKEEREITLRLDTVRFTGDRNVRATVSLREVTHGYTASVTIPVSARIRTDVEVSPSHIGFGTIEHGKSYTQKININYNGGRPNWTIKELRAGNAFFKPQLIEKGRFGGSAQYEVQVVIDGSAPQGQLRDQLVVVTDEVGGSDLTIPIEAKVEPDIVVTDLAFGTVAPGVPKSMNVIVRGKKPFKISEISHVARQVVLKPADATTPDGKTLPASNLTVAFASMPDEAFKVKFNENVAAVHMVALTFTPPTETGLFEEEFVVKIEGREQPVTFKVKGRIAPQTAASGRKNAPAIR